VVAFAREKTEIEAPIAPRDGNSPDRRHEISTGTRVRSVIVSETSKKETEVKFDLRKCLIVLALVLIAPLMVQATESAEPAPADEPVAAETSEAPNAADEVGEALLDLQPEELRHDTSTLCNVKCSSNAHCVGVCPGGENGFCLRDLGEICGPFPQDKFCNCF
jgi:hypothetical protein